LLLAALSSCVDLSEKQLVGPYYVAQDPVGSSKTLFYYAPSEGPRFDRIYNVCKAGYTPAFIFAESKNGFYFIKRAQDRPSDLGDPEVQKAISQPLTQAGFKAFLDSIGAAGFAFQYSAICSSR
ncbi:MAG TPA: hypothetical protein VF598_00160, partial [Hymenobacter sp.]